jgi:hypothetical protein
LGIGGGQILAVLNGGAVEWVLVILPEG